MRQYLSWHNFKSAAVLSAAVTFLSVHRILEGGMPPGIFIPAAFCAMTLVAGMATAWAHEGGLNGLFPHKLLILQRSAIAIALSLLLAPVTALLCDPIVTDVLHSTDNAAALRLSLPPTLDGRLALLAWAGSFEALFFVAAPMSFMARLTGRRDTAILFTTLFRAGVTYGMLHSLGFEQASLAFAIASAAVTYINARLFASGGLIPCMLLSAGTSLHVFLAPSVG